MPIQNILLISIDDMNDWIGPLGGHPDAVTPNLSALAARSVVFDAAMIPAASCSPSRTATMYGQAPWITGVYNNKALWNDYYAPDQQFSFVGRLRQAGYRTILGGKVTHGVVDGRDWKDVSDLPGDRFPAISQAVQQGLIPSTFDFGPSPVDAPPLVDALQAAYIISKMQAGDTGKLWAYGVHRPHSPFVVPQAYFDMIAPVVANPPGLFQVPFDPANDAALANLPGAALSVINPNRKVPAGVYQTGEYNPWIRAYLAAIAYADDCIGRVLDKIEDCGLDQNTLIVLWSDNGMQFGEKQCGRKFTLWERVLRVPLMIAGPGVVPRHVPQPVSLMDIYPTVAALTGITAPYPLSGTDLSGTVLGTANPVGVALSAWVRKSDPGIALSVRTQEYRFTRYWNGQCELYDHTFDPHEHNNLAGNPTYQPVINSLQSLLPTSLATPIDGSGTDDE